MCDDQPLHCGEAHLAAATAHDASDAFRSGRGKIGWKVQLISINKFCVGTFSCVHFSILKSLGFSMDLMVEIPSHHMDLSNNGLIYEIRTR